MSRGQGGGFPNKLVPCRAFLLSAPLRPVPSSKRNKLSWGRRRDEMESHSRAQAFLCFHDLVFSFPASESRHLGNNSLRENGHNAGREVTSR